MVPLARIDTCVWNNENNSFEAMVWVSAKYRAFDAISLIQKKKLSIQSRNICPVHKDDFQFTVGLGALN